jgi:hypothetical protein
MADQIGLMDVLKNPNYINANKATKKAIFEKYSAKDKNYSDANDATKSAIRQKFGVDKAEEKEPSMMEKAGKFIGDVSKDVIESGGIVDIRKFLSPEKAAEAVTTGVSKKIGAPIVKDVSIDPSKIGSQSAGDYASKIMQRGGEGMIAGTGLAPFTGGGSILAGGAGGALQGLAEATAADLGLSGDLQQAAGIMGPAAAGFVMSKIPQTSQQINSVLNSDAANAIKSKLAHKAITKALGLPYWTSSIIEKVPKAFEGLKTPDYKAVGKELGATGETLGIGGTKYTDAANQELSQLHPDISPAKGEKISNVLYERAKTAYNDANAEESFLSSPEFKTLHGDIPAEKTKFEEIFQNKKGEAYTGEDVINNLQTGKMENISYKDMDKAREALNKYLLRTTKVEHESNAREAFTIESAARAKDTLPGLFADNDAKGINKELWNLSKTPEGISIFNNELVNGLKSTNVKSAKILWGKIGPNVKDKMEVDPKTYKKVTDIINGAKTAQDIDRATRIIRRFAAPAVATVTVESYKDKQ